MARGPELRKHGYHWPSGDNVWVSREWLVTMLHLIHDLMYTGIGNVDNFVSKDAQRRERTAKWALTVAINVLADMPGPITGMSVKWLVRSLNKMGLLDEALKDIDDEDWSDEDDGF